MSLKTEKENSQSQTRNKSFAWMKYILCFKIVLEYLTINLIAQYPSINVITELLAPELVEKYQSSDNININGTNIIAKMPIV